MHALSFITLVVRLEFVPQLLKIYLIHQKLAIETDCGQEFRVSGVCQILRKKLVCYTSNFLI